jgi:hypothetical protein
MNIKSIKESNFKYTTNKERKKWIKHLYPFGEYLIHLFSKIDYNNYSYKGKFRAWYMDDDDEYKYDDINIEAKHKKSLTPFYYFGGVSYELLNESHKCVDLHKYVDPTADIDIGLELPFVQINETKKDYMNYFFDSKKKSFETLSDFVKDYIEWLFKEIKKLFESIPKHIFDDIFGECENIHGDITVHNKIKLTSFYENNMVKIQGLCKFKDIPEDNFFDMILSLNDLEDTVFLNKGLKNFLKLKKDVYITDLKSLFFDDMLALKTRIRAINSNEYKNLKHKFYNHIGRFNYLIDFISKCVLKENVLNLSNNEITNLIDYSLKVFVLYYLLKESNKLKLVNYTDKLNTKNIINSHIKDYYELLKEKNRLKENQSALSLENKSFKKSQINGLEVDVKKKTDSKEPYILYKNIYETLFSNTEGGRKNTTKIKTRKLKYYSNR